MDKSKALEFAQKYANEVTKVLAPSQIILYGSYAKGTQHDESDIDIAVICDDFNGDLLETSSLLWRMTRNVSSYIEPILLDGMHDPSGFVEEIRRVGAVIYQHA